MIPLLLFFLLDLFASRTHAASSFHLPTPPTHIVTDLTSIPIDIPSYTTNLVSTVLAAHNTLRSLHSAPALRWNSTLGYRLQYHVDQCTFTPSNRGWGENLSAGYTNSTAAVMAWAGESANFAWTPPLALSEGTGSFTQMIWVDTKTMGCAAAKCRDLVKVGKWSWLLACAYWPRGNIDDGAEDGGGLVERNVLPHVNYWGSGASVGRKDIPVVAVAAAAVAAASMVLI